MTYLSRIEAFIANWEDRFVEVNPDEVFKQSPQGNINTDGTSACCDSPALSKYHRYFKKSIEPGVRDLTVALILKFNCITYSSCQGHLSTPDAAMRPRYVAMLPRDDNDYRRLFQILQDLADLTNSQLPENPVKVVLGSDILESETCTMPGITLFFVAADEISETTYFMELDKVYAHLCQIIQNYSV
ncbi:MAG TPA: hypothetical protein IGS52_24520 [Oscillatoriaceae cyanobacterium M33_DOE_052]|uniref:Uncharacterized protein n=1 Tax=Planktothricoides sp. SpSt-374 TaxID=2282167 RepID=A0A7C3VP71_9CYAN|nr:hypothetical protein [Oscillatoriaceae cyanobacterium M33_DOE_052]